jgi:hypothetical protein
MAGLVPPVPPDEPPVEPLPPDVPPPEPPDVPPLEPPEVPPPLPPVVVVLETVTGRGAEATVLAFLSTATAVRE